MFLRRAARDLGIVLLAVAPVGCSRGLQRSLLETGAPSDGGLAGKGGNTGSDGSGGNGGQGGAVGSGGASGGGSGGTSAGGSGDVGGAVTGGATQSAGAGGMGSMGGASQLPDASVQDPVFYDASVDAGPGLLCGTSLYPAPAQECMTLDLVFPFRAGDVETSSSGLFSVFPREHTVALTYQAGGDHGEDFWGWSCFNVVPDAVRVAAHYNYDVAPTWGEVLVATADGRLFHRAHSDNVWNPWSELAGPGDPSCVLDVATVQSVDEENFRLLVDGGAIYESHTSGPYLQSATAWQRVPSSSATRVAGAEVDGHAWILALTANGAPIVAKQAAPEVSAAFGTFSRLGLGAPRLRAIDAVTLPESGLLDILAVDGDGAVWHLGPAKDFKNVDWENLEPQGPAVQIVEVAGGVMLGDVVTWFGVTAGEDIVKRIGATAPFWEPMTYVTQ